MDAKDKKLHELLQGLESVLVAYSGGVDSTYLLKKCLDTLGQDRVLAVTAVSESYPERERKEAVRLAEELGARHRLIHTSELAIEHFANNPRDRCYYCKKELFKNLIALAQKEGLAAVVDGANHDDISDYRPGSRATAELGVLSPLQQVGMTKDEIRSFSRTLGLPTWSKPAFACLASRFPYGEEITAEKLSQVAAVEEYLHERGFNQLRVRHHGSVARLEVEVSERHKALEEAQGIYAACKKAGFTYASLDLLGYRQGSMNE